MRVSFIAYLVMLNILNQNNVPDPDDLSQEVSADIEQLIGTKLGTAQYYLVKPKLQF